jgi:hypothetical protein
VVFSGKILRKSNLLINYIFHLTINYTLDGRNSMRNILIILIIGILFLCGVGAATFGEAFHQSFQKFIDENTIKQLEAHRITIWNALGDPSVRIA